MTRFYVLFLFIFFSGIGHQDTKVYINSVYSVHYIIHRNAYTVYVCLCIASQWYRTLQTYFSHSCHCTWSPAVRYSHRSHLRRRKYIWQPSVEDRMTSGVKAFTSWAATPRSFLSILSIKLPKLAPNLKDQLAQDNLKEKSSEIFRHLPPSKIQHQTVLRSKGHLNCSKLSGPTTKAVVSSLAAWMCFLYPFGKQMVFKT